jgi:uncharacterized protein (TIGR03083 family)
VAAPARARVRPRFPALDRDTAYGLAATECDRFLAVLRDLDPEDWDRPTDCTGWNVRALAAHVLGTVEMVASLLELAHQVRAARKAGGGDVGLTAVQVRERAELDGGGIVAGLQVTWPRALVRRRRMSRVLGRLPLPEKQVVGGAPEWWRLGFFFDVILTRDVWMHRIDLARATDRKLELTPDHDGVLVADLVQEWADRHGRPYRLRLTGPAGGEWSSGTGGEELELDAVEFGRILSGRGSGAGLLGQRVPF